MAGVSSLTTFDSFVRKMLFKKGASNSDYIIYMAILADAFQHLNFNHIGVVKSVKLDVVNNCVPYPSDYINYIHLGVDDGSGKIWTFTRDDKLVIEEVFSPITCDSTVVTSDSYILINTEYYG